MTWDITNALRFGKQPIWLYEFERDGLTTRLASTWGSDYVDENAVTWTKSPITHTRFRVTSALNREETELIFPASDVLAQSYLGDLSYQPNTLKIYHEYRNQTPLQRVTKFDGAIVGSDPRLTRTTKRIRLVARNRITEVQAKGLATVMQTTCPHVVYHKTPDGYGCGADIVLFQVAATCSALSNRVATIAEAALQPDAHYSGGYLDWNGRRQRIQGHVGATITLLNDIPGFAAAVAGGSQPVLIARGCPRLRQVCNDDFGQLEDNGSFPGMAETPFNGKINY